MTQLEWFYKKTDTDYEAGISDIINADVVRTKNKKQVADEINKANIKLQNKLNIIRNLQKKQQEEETVKIVKRTTNVLLVGLQSPIKDFSGININIPNFFIYNPKYLSAVADQKSCGACSFYSTTGMLADRINISIYDTYKKTINLKTSDLIDCFDSKLKDNNCYGSSGVEKVLMWANKNNFRFDIINNKENNDFNVIDKCKDDNKGGVVIKNDSIRALCTYINERDLKPEDKDYNKLTNIINTNIRNMKLELMLYGTFYTTIMIYDNFLNISGYDIYRKPKKANQLGGHAVVVVGWCDKGVDKRKGFEDGYWICRNSWGTEWGKTNWDINSEKKIDYGLNGYFLILMGSNSCGVETMCGSAEPNLNIKSSNIPLMSYNNYDKYFADRLIHAKEEDDIKKTEMLKMVKEYRRYNE